MRHRYTEEEVIIILKEFYEENGNRITPNEYSNSGCSPSVSTIINMFGSWKIALIKANLPSVPSGKKQELDREQTCVICGKVFRPKTETQITCSQVCLSRHGKRKEYYRRKELGLCTKCGAIKEDETKTRCEKCILKSFKKRRNL